jgi:hypothetical protein
LRARAQYEVKLFHGVSPPEPKDRKEAMLGPFVNADDSYMRYRMSYNFPSEIF